MRRTSVAERNKLGDPYRIYSELQNVGKTVEGSKKRMRWVFGFTESNEEYEVTLTHSMVSGKRTIIENGREIVSTTNIMATDFSYGWDSPSTSRLFRIEAQSNITSENDYTFTIDGIRFNDLPSKPLGGGGRKSLSGDHNPQNSRYGSDVHSHTKRGSEHSSSHSHDSGHGTAANPPSSQNRSSITNRSSEAASRAQFQSPANKSQSRSGDDFDPFGAKTEPFDPFGNETTPKNQNNTSNNRLTAPPSSGNNNKSGAAAKSLFDSLDEESTSTATNNNNLKSASFDAFNDSFAGETAPANSNNNDYGFDPFGNDNGNNKKPTPTKGLAGPPGNQTQANRTAQQSQDFFGSQPVTSSGGSGNGAQRRSSAVEISMDFAGLSFEAKPATPVATESQHPRDKPVVEESPKPVEEETIDPWASNLVDLDLSGKGAAARRASLQTTSGPSLNQMLGTNPAAKKRPSWTPDDPFGAPDLVPLNNARPQPTPVMPMKPLNAAQAISSLGTAPVGMGGGPPHGYGYGMPPQPPHMQMGGGYQPNNMGIGGGGVGMGPGMGLGRNSMTGAPVGGGMGMMGGPPPPAPVMSNTRGSFIALPPDRQPKSSLDALDWKQFN